MTQPVGSPPSPPSIRLHVFAPSLLFGATLDQEMIVCSHLLSVILSAEERASARRSIDLRRLQLSAAVETLCDLTLTVAFYFSVWRLWCGRTCFCSETLGLLVFSFHGSRLNSNNVTHHLCGFLGFFLVCLFFGFFFLINLHKTSREVARVTCCVRSHAVVSLTVTISWVCCCCCFVSNGN